MVPRDSEPRRPLAYLPRGRAVIPLRHLFFSLVLCVSLGLNVLSG